MNCFTRFHSEGIRAPQPPGATVPWHNRIPSECTQTARTQILKPTISLLEFYVAQVPNVAAFARTMPSDPSFGRRSLAVGA